MCRRRIACRTLVDPDWTGRWTCLQTRGRSRIASTSRSEACLGCGLANRIRSTPRNVVDGREQRSEVAVRVVGRLVVVDDLPEQVDFPPAAGDGVLDVRQDLGLRAHPLAAPRVRNDAERAVVVAALEDGDVRLDRVGPPCDPEWEADVVVWIQIDLGLPGRGSPAPPAGGSCRDGMGADDDVDVAGALED